MEEPRIVVPGTLTLNQLMPGDQWADLRRALIETGKWVTNTPSGKSKETRVQLRRLPDGDHEIMALGAVSRSAPGSQTYVELLQDFERSALSSRNQEQYVPLLWAIYGRHGLVNNAVNKSASLLAGKGEFVIRSAKAGKKRTPVENALKTLNYWVKNVNSPLPMLNSKKQEQGAVVTGARGLRALTRQGGRVALVEGSWVGRHSWTTVDVPGIGKAGLPMTIQTISTANLEPVTELLDTVVELFYWKPPSNLLTQLRGPLNKDIEKIIKKLIPKDAYNLFKQESKILLDPALLLHVKHRGRDGRSFGESFMEPALGSIAYEQAILQLDQVAMQNLINRLTIVQVGSTDPNSPYARDEVAKARANLLQTFFEDPGPNMTIVWAGHDIKVDDIGAYNAVLDLDARLATARTHIKEALGVSEALLSGASTDSKAAGWASILGLNAQIQDLSDQFAGLWTNLGHAILIENGYTDIDVEWVFEDRLILDSVQERQIAGQEYVRGYRSIRSVLKTAGLDPDLEYQQRCVEQGIDPNAGVLWKDVFIPVQGLQGQGGVDGAPGEGRTPGNPSGKPPATPLEKPSSQETK
jgi:hypothetical protein